MGSFTHFLTLRGKDEGTAKAFNEAEESAKKFEKRILLLGAALVGSVAAYKLVSAGLGP